MSTDFEDKDGGTEDVATGDEAEEEDDVDPAERRCGISLNDHPEE